MFRVFRKIYLSVSFLCMAACIGTATAQKSNVVTTAPYTGFNQAHDIAVDATGNIFIANSGGSDLLEQPASGSAQITLASGVAYPLGTVVDTAGNVYVGDLSGPLDKIPVGGGTAVNLLNTPACAQTTQYYIGARSLAVDGADDVYFVGGSGTGPPPNTSGEYIYEVTPAGVCSIRLDLSSFGKDIYYVSSDPSGNLTFAFNGSAQLYSLPAGASAATALSATFTAINGLRADKYGNVFISDANTIDEIPFDTVAGALAPARMEAVLQRSSVSAIGIGPGGALYTTDGGAVYQSVRTVVTALAANSLLSNLNQSGDILYSAVGNSQPTGSLGGLAFDSSGNTWSANSGDNVLTLTAPLASISTPYTGGGLSAPDSVAVDGQNFILVANSGNGSFSVFTDAGTAQSGTSGFGKTSLTQPSAIAIDMSGGVWITNNKSGQSSVTHILGGAYPVLTPIVSGVAAGTLGVEP